MNSKLERLLTNSRNNYNTVSSTSSSNYYDLIIIGAGISGLETALKLGHKYKNKNKKILVLDRNDYIGGRVKTVNDIYKGKKFKYEAGAARFNDNHKTLLSIIKRYNLQNKIVKIPSYWEFRPTDKYNKKSETIPFNNIEELLAELVKYYDKPIHYKYLLSVSIYEACRDLYGSKIAEYLQNSYSYYSEIKVFNGVNGIRSLKHDLGEHNQFYILKNGLSQIINNQALDFFSSKGTRDNKSSRLICLKTLVGSWKYDDISKVFNINTLDIETNTNKKIIGKNLVIAVDGKSIRQWRKQFNTIQPKINNVIDHVVSQPLLRTYAIYDSLWFKKYGKVVTDSLVKYIIPVDYKLGLIMISYTDGEYARKMMRHIKDGTQEKAIYTSLKEIFPDEKIESKPGYLRNEYWETGAVYWGKGADSKKMSEFMINPSRTHNLFICGDSFSENQAWTDGALFNSHKVIQLIKL